MHVENCIPQTQKQMAGTGESVVGESVTLELKETIQPMTKQGEAVVETVKCHGESSKPFTIHQTQTKNKNTIAGNVIDQKQCNDIVKELSGLQLGGIPKTDSKSTRKVSLPKDIIRIGHQNNISETDDDDNITSRNSKAAENTSSAAPKTNKNKKPKSKKNKRKKSQSQPLTPEERASFNKFVKDLITNEVRRSSLNKMMMSQQGGENDSRTHRTSQGESVDSVNGLSETVEVDCRKPRNVNGIVAHDYSDSIQSLTDNGESLPCSAYSDYHSEDSGSDSGKGGSDIQGAVETFNGSNDCPSSYTFEVPQDLCGALIGKRGRLINAIEDQSSTKIFVREHVVFATTKLCTIEGAQVGIKKALHLIRKRFPASHFPSLTLQQLVFQAESIAVPEAMQLRLPEGVGCEVIVSSMLCPGQIFLQQPTHPTYSTLTTLVHSMTSWYSQVEAPGILNPQEGNLCAVPGVNGWYRAKVINVLDDSKDCEVMFLDYGGYSRTPFTLLRQLRGEYLTLPFQSQECFLANVQPLDGENEWSAESVQIFEGLATGSVLQANIVGYSINRTPLVHLFKITNSFVSIFINEELVNSGFAKWFDY